MPDDQLRLPEGWRRTAGGAGMVGPDGQKLEFVIAVANDGYDLVLEVDGTVQRERVRRALRKQLEVLLRKHEVLVDRRAVDLLHQNLTQTIVWEAEGIAEEIRNGLAGDDQAYRLFVESEREPSDVSVVMQKGPEPVPMLIPEWLAEGEMHLLYAEPEGAKTWTALWLALQVVRQGGFVVWVDEELGADAMAERFLALGATVDEIKGRFCHLEFPSWGTKEIDEQEWRIWVRTLNPDLVVFDTMTDLLAEGGFDEDRGIDVTNWVKAYSEPAKRIGAAVLVLDHVPKNAANTRYAIGSRAKKAKAKVQLYIEVTRDFDRDTVGEIHITETKNTPSAAIPKERFFQIGGTPFRFEPIANDAVMAKKSAEANSGLRLRHRIVELLHAHEPHELTTTQIVNQLSGKRATIQEALRDMADSALWAIAARPKGQSTAYRYDPAEKTDDG